MRIAIAGGTGRIGRLTSAVLESAGHQAVPFSRAAGVDADTGRGLDDALRGANALIDVTSTPASDKAEIVDFFGTVTRNLLAAGERAGVRHHVLLSIVGIDHNKSVPHYAGKREQERLVESGPVPWSIVRATQFHDYPAMVDMARRTLAVRGQDIKLVPTWRGNYGTDLVGEAMLPGEGARLGSTTFDAWLAADAK